MSSARHDTLRSRCVSDTSVNAMKRRVGWNAVISLVFPFVLPTANVTAQQLDLFASGVARHTRAESALGYREAKHWEGAVGLGLQLSLLHHVFLEVAVERRRDVSFMTAGGRLCGPYRNTCFETHRILISSTPVVVLAHYRHDSARVGPIASIGIRLVPRPHERDLTVGQVPRSYFRLSSPPSRTTPEVGLGCQWIVSKGIVLYAEGRSLTHAGAVWDPRRRVQGGMLVRF